MVTTFSNRYLFDNFSYGLFHADEANPLEQLFPSIEPYAAANYRAHDALNHLGQIFSAPGASSHGQSLIDNFISTISGLVFETYKHVLAVDYTHFTSWQDLYGPRTHYGDNFTSVIRYNLRDPILTTAVGGLTVSGCGNRSNVPSQPFDAKNIIMVRMTSSSIL